MKIKSVPKGGCIFWHRWRLIRDTGFTQYHECRDCRARHARQPDGGGHQPIDIDWVVLGKDMR